MIAAGVLTVALAVRIGTAHSTPTAFQYSSSWSGKALMAASTWYEMT